MQHKHRPVLGIQYVLLHPFEVNTLRGCVVVLIVHGCQPCLLEQVHVVAPSRVGDIDFDASYECFDNLCSQSAATSTRYRLGSTDPIGPEQCTITTVGKAQSYFYKLRYASYFCISIISWYDSNRRSNDVSIHPIHPSIHPIT